MSDYVNNEDLVKEINKSKLSYCWIKDGYDGNYSYTCSSLSEIDTPTEGTKYRVYTDEHIPAGSVLGRRGPVKNLARVNFIPFKHYIYENGEFVEIVRSHWHKGKYSNTHGRHTNELAQMYMLMVEEYGKRGNWKGYTYLDELKANAIVHLVRGALMYDEAKSTNAFSYLTQIIYNGFVQQLNKEQEEQFVKEEMLVEAGLEPSFDYEEKKKKREEEIMKKSKRDMDKRRKRKLNERNDFQDDE